MFSSKMPWDFWLIFTVLAVVIPWRGRLRLRRLLALDRVGSKQKITLYLTTIAFQWIMASLVAWRALARGLTPAELGLAPGDSWSIVFPSLSGALVLGGLHWLNLRRVGQMEGPAPALMKSIASKVLPDSVMEFLPYFALAVTAGVCEEFVYRGFAMAALAKAGLPTWLVVLLTAFLFGLAHTYQGKSGIAGTSLMGLVFGGFRILSLSLVPLAVWHATVDIVAGVAGQKFLFDARNSKQDQLNQ
jgi:membrane protease YdiL (CAAX protease family)